jgi:hypothetical protein
MDYHLAIPSHRRAKLLGDKTLHFLKESKGPKPTIYVADEEDLTAYRNLYPDLPILLAPKGIAATRNFIQDSQPIGKKIVFIDDDIIDIFHLDVKNHHINTVTSKPKKYKVRDFDALVQEGFASAEKAGTSWWGVMPTDHTLCMKPAIRRNLCYINGSLFGVINSRVSVKENHCEDFERSLRYWVKEGKLCRLEFVGLLTKYLKNPGGLQETRNEVMTSESAHRIMDEFPTLCKIRKKKGKWEDLSFKRFPPNFIFCSTNHSSPSSSEAS